jgi:hypothetical protein
MWIFICLLCAIGVLLTLTRISLLEHRGRVLLLAFVTAMASVITIPWATRVNTQELTRFLNRLEVLNDLCTLLVIESLLMLLGAARLMKRHVAREPIGAATGILLLPSSGCLAGIFIVMVLLFNEITGRSYAAMGSLYGVGIGMLLAGGAVPIRRIIKAWDARLEVLLILSFVQLILAMFLPLVASGFTVPTQTMHNHIVALLGSAALSAMSAVLALLVRAIYHAVVGDKTP